MNENSTKLDELDYRLIFAVQDSPRSSYRDLAEELHTSESTVRRRLNALIEAGTVSISAVPDPFKLGYQVVAFIGLHVQPSNIDAIAKRLVALPNIHYVSLCSGSVDFMIWGYFASTGKLADFIANDLGQIPGITHTETMIQLRFLKRSLGVGHIDMENAGLAGVGLGRPTSRERRNSARAISGVQNSKPRSSATAKDANDSEDSSPAKRVARNRRNVAGLREAGRITSTGRKRRRPTTGS